ncbi:MAG: type II toxin-antitoxin system RelE/ParE family toxin [Candidatus Koribacter versatilis]|nr:type II toxin-antitoxin system RelE/ParE family toxin [Candidatus Koribacter versatilis]
MERLGCSSPHESVRVFGRGRFILPLDRKGQHSIRINDQHRLCFVWRDGNAHEVEIVDYH